MNSASDNDPNLARDQIDSLSQEVLELYRQLNLIYRLGDAFQAGLGSDDVIAQLMKECRKVVRAKGALVTLHDGRRFGQSPTAPRSTLDVVIESPTTRFGSLTLYDKRRGPFNAADEKLLLVAARQAGVALENSGKIEGLIEERDALEKLNAELRLFDQMKSDFVSNVSHELRTPLASIKGFSSTILSDTDMPEPIAREFISIIDKESDKLIAIINDLLDVSKMMAGEMEYTLAPIALHDVVEETAKLLRIQSEAKGLSLTFVREDHAEVFVDRTRISQVLVNLIGNAIKFTERGGVSVRQWVTDSDVHLAVSDTGIGIPKALIAHIFDKFYRVENVIHTKEGTGLGLALVRSIIDYHGGRITVESELGKGSVFTMHLPVHVPKA